MNSRVNFHHSRSTPTFLSPKLGDVQSFFFFSLFSIFCLSVFFFLGGGGVVLFSNPDFSSG